MAERRKPSTRTVWTLVGALGLLLLAFALIIGPWLFTRHPQKNLTSEQELTAKNGVRTTLVQALGGLAVAGGLIVTYRTYRQNQLEQDRTYERELYATAIEQLGHHQAPVRFGTLYSLESLAQDRPDRRQRVVDVLCAYLRMPFPPPGEATPKADLRDVQQPAEKIAPPVHDPAQELQVRKTVERLLATHLCLPRNMSAKEAQQRPASPDEIFWPGISLDLTGATLVELRLERALVVEARFSGATFTDHAVFQEATITGSTWFDGATFTGMAAFRGAAFTNYAGLTGATFSSSASFDEATFSSSASFDEATFTRHAGFSRATFTRYAGFSRATFCGDAGFAGATFAGFAGFIEATFSNTARFSGATFADIAMFHGAKVLRLDDPDLNKKRSWPLGWFVRPDPTDPTSGVLTTGDLTGAVQPNDQSAE